MADYTSLGIEKVTRQARVNRALVRCPRDGAVMRVTGSRAERRDGTAESQRFVGLPSGRDWVVTELDLECPACRRVAEGIAMAGPSELVAGERHV